MIEGRIELVLPDIVLAEVERVLAEKLGFSDERRHDASRLHTELAADRPAAAGEPEPVTGDCADDAILSR